MPPLAFNLNEAWNFRGSRNIGGTLGLVLIFHSVMAHSDSGPVRHLAGLEGGSGSIEDLFILGECLGEGSFAHVVAAVLKLS